MPSRIGRRMVLFAALLGLLGTGVDAQQLPPSTKAPKVGEQAPDFVLPDTDGNSVQLADLLKGPGGTGQWVLLVFYRGYW